MMKNLAIIPARAGSKRILSKNIRHFCGKPIIAYAIQTAIKSNLFSDVIVSTDSQEIKTISEHYGASVPFFRPEKLADDYATTHEVLKHAVDWFSKAGNNYDYLCCIYPTSVFITPDFLKEGYKKISGSELHMVMSVCSYDFPVQRSLRYDEQGFLHFVWPEHKLSRSNDLQDYYHDAAQFYWLNWGSFLLSGDMYSGKVNAVKIPRKQVIDIDTEEDWEQAEQIFRWNRRVNEF